ncbi:MAG: acetate--CoA ligase family protein [Alphaproteobacteria bacterium]|nr:acetate--CoA ligase family protein [Alphaproteobacteria bacterium]
MRPIDRLLRPTSIAVIGGGAWCANVVRECQEIGFAGGLWPVHPHRAEIDGVPAYASVGDLPNAPDAAFVGVNREATIGILRELAERGAGGAVCFASGFREFESETGDGAALQTALIEAAGDMAILGPNCYGFINALDGAALWPDRHGAARVDNGVAIISQSSNVALNLTMQRRGLPLAYIVTVGNQAKIDLTEIGRALLDDPRVTALGLFIEGVGDIRAFEAMAESARAKAKPVIALKLGASSQAKATAVSHTASLAGSDAGAKALLDRLGIGRVRSLSALLETLKLLHVGGPLPSNRIASMSCSGGEAGLMADSALGLDLDFSPLNEQQRKTLRAALGPKVALANPLDYHTYIWGDRAALADCFSAMMDPNLALGCVVVDFPRTDGATVPEWDMVIEAVDEAQARSGVRMALLASLTETMPEEIAKAVMARGITPLGGLDEGLEAIAIAASLGGKAPNPLPVLLPNQTVADQTLTEADAKAALEAHGLDIPSSRRARSIAEAKAVAESIGFPVVLKGEGVAHKTEAGLVALDLKDALALCAAAAAMSADSFLVEEMITGGVVELLIGVVCDPAHGFVLTIGAGGTLTELLEDSASLLLPADRAEIESLLERLRIAPLLEGYRGAAPASVDAVIDAVMAIQAYVCDTADRLVEIEVNPLICTPHRAIAADALIRLGEPT